jgi:Domain of unknown function (DUF397)
MLSTQPVNAGWRVSTWSKSDNCVEIANNDAAVLIRDTKNRTGGVLAVPSTVWEGFIDAIQTDSISLK